MNQVKEYRKLMEELEEKVKTKEVDIQILEAKVQSLEQQTRHLEMVAQTYKDEFTSLSDEHNKMKRAVQTTVKELAAFII